MNYKHYIMNYDRIDDSEGIDVIKANESRDCHIFHYWYFFDKGFKFQPDVCNGCHDVLMTSMNVNIIAFLNADYFCIISEISKTRLTSLYILI